MITLKKLQESISEAGYRPVYHAGDEEKYAKDAQHLFQYAQSMGGQSYGYSETPQNCFGLKDVEREHFETFTKYLKSRGYQQVGGEKSTEGGGKLRTFFAYLDGKKGNTERPWAKVTHTDDYTRVELMKGSGSGVEPIPDQPNQAPKPPY